MQKIEFEERVVAFIDVLGFKPIVTNSLLSKDDSSLLEELNTALETDVPRVELSNVAKELWLKTEGTNNAVCLEYKNCFMVNGLHDYYIPDDTHGSAERTFKQYSDILKNSIENIYENSVRYQWWWFGEFLESEIKRNPFIMHT